MSPFEIAAIGSLVFLVAILYSSVGHAGASGYLAVMGLFGVAALVMRPTALILNLLVSIIGTTQFARAGHFRWRNFWPFAVTSIPFSFWGGAVHLSDATYKQLVGAVLLFAAWRLAAFGRGKKEVAVHPVPIVWGLILGAAIGFLSGLTSVGGGIFLTPLLLLMHWADPKQAAAASVVFILVNSASGLAGQVAGHASTAFVMPATSLLIVWGTAAIAGGAIGSTLGSRHIPALALRRLLAVVLVIAGIKLLSERQPMPVVPGTGHPSPKIPADSPKLSSLFARGADLQWGERMDAGNPARSLELSRFHDEHFRNNLQCPDSSDAAPFASDASF